VWAALPHAGRSSEAIAAPEPKVEYKNPALAEPSVFPDSRDMLQRIAGLITHGILPDHQHLVQRGHAGFALAVQEARRQLLGSELTHAVVLAVDTLIESPTLQWLLDHGRLKTDANPVGLMPGEAGVAVLLEPAGRASSRKARSLASIAAVAVAEDEHHLFSDKPPIGMGLAAAVQDLHKQLPDGVQTPWIISDHSGEVHRATDWGYALPRLVRQIDAWKDPLVSYPAISFGDTGSASGGVELAVAIRSYARKYAPARDAVLVTSSDHGERAAIAVSQAA
jgi:3-oxoacyl-[acyl-carrier-protein] synthase-1